MIDLECQVERWSLRVLHIRNYCAVGEYANAQAVIGEISADVQALKRQVLE